jgi:outer membrane protein OmpA-like peptidoglycan-associated protein
MSGERGVASDFPFPLSSQSRSAASLLLPPSEEIQELVIFSLAKPVALTRMEPINAPVVADIYFDERRLFIDTGLKAFFLQTVEWLAAEPQWRLRIEGHCDPRGPSAYNFVRADFHLVALADYLSRLGIPSHRISTVNYGQDPVRCRLTSEQCQEDNLRAENIFPILSVGNTQRGCLARLRLIGGENWSRVHQVSQSLPLLQRIQVASPSSSF